MANKNDGFVARFFQRDSDTLAGWNNVGVLMYEIFHEWGDSYDPATGKTGTIVGERYDAVTDSFVPDCTVGEPVYNGRLSGLWDCVAKAWSSDLGQMYRDMRAAGLNFDYLWGLYQQYRTQWCEAMYNADAMGYANTGRFDMAYGDKSEAMRYILKARLRYLDSKYMADTSTPFVLSLSGTGNGVAVRYYCPIYGTLNWGAGTTEPQRAITPGEPVYFPSPGVTFNDTTSTFYNADCITEITTYTQAPDGSKTEGGLQDIASGLYIRTGEDNLRRLKSLVLDYSGRAANTALGGNVLNIAQASVALRRFVVRNYPNVSGEAIFKSQVIEEIDLRDTNVAKITVPSTDTLKSVHLGNPTEVRFEGMGELSDFSVDEAMGITAFTLRDCPKAPYRPILKVAINSGALASADINGIDWSDFTAKQIERLADIGAKLEGIISLPRNEKMTFDLKQKCLLAWGAIDSEDNPLRIIYEKGAMDYVRIAGAGYFSDMSKTYRMTLVSESGNANDFTRIEWSMTSTAYASIDAATGVIALKKVGTEKEAPTAVVTAKIYCSDGTVVTKTATVGFYARTPKIGDYVYADGSISDIRDESKTVVCIFWREQTYSGRKYRFGFAPKAISGNIAWGAESQLSDIPTSDVSMADIVGIPNCSFDASAPAADKLVDEGQPDGWMVYAETALLRNGMCVADTDSQAYNKGDIIPLGMRETWAIIRTRNAVIGHSAVQSTTPQIRIPAAQGGASELDDLKSLITSANASPGNAYRYYYPAASYAFAYQPEVKEGEVLADCFKVHRWFLPTPGDMQMMLYSFLTRDAEAYASAVANADIVLSGYAHTTGEHSNTKYCAKVIVSNRNFAFGDYNTLQPKQEINALVSPMVVF